MDTVKKLKQRAKARAALWGGVGGLMLSLTLMVYVEAVAPSPQGAGFVLSVIGMCGLVGAVVGFVFASTRDDKQ